jgi:pantoate--beta-alanine ligase
MQTVVSLSELRDVRAALAEPVGLVPTMGYLHEGHLSLVRRARSECATVVTTIFVNPTQFGPEEDLSTYPRDLDRDLQLLQDEEVDLVWMPTPDVMYPPNFQTWVTVQEVTQPLEGGRRPGHFQGVTTVVTKLFTAVLPHKAYFGQKDAQQTVVIQQMTRDLNFPIDIIVCPTVRERDGLAMSSRNAYLNPDERRAATVLHHSLTAACAAFQEGERDAKHLRQMVSDIIASEPLARLQYVSCAHPNTLDELDVVTDRALLSLAVFIGKTRLIDNMILDG